jgi:hypothetical protein
MEAYVAAVEEVCIAPTPGPSQGEIDTPAASLTRRIARIGEIADQIAAIEPPPEEAEAARRYLVDLMQAYHDNLLRHQDEILAAAERGGTPAAGAVMTALKVSPLIDEAGVEWITKNGIGDCRVGVTQYF